MKEKKNNGISLIILVITIVVIIILAGAVILSLLDNNPINVANKAVFLSDVKNFQTELELYKTQQFTDSMGNYTPTLLQADETSVIYNGNIIEGLTVNDLIPSLGNAIKYTGQFIVKDGQLVYQGADVNKQDWAIASGTQVLIIGEPKVTIVPLIETVVEKGTDIVYTIKFFSNVAITTVNLEGNIEVLDSNEIVLPVQPLITIGTLSGTNLDTTRQVDITISTDNLLDGLYKLKIKSGVVTNANNESNTQDIISLIGFDISDTTLPVNPTMSVNVTDWINGNVSVTIIYSEDSIVKEYSFDALTWSLYTVPVIVTENNVTVYARGKDLAGNESGVSTLTIANIDKIIPTVTATNGGVTTSSVKVNALASDTGGSGLNTSSYEYSKDNGTTWTSPTSAINYTFTGLTTGTYNCRVRVSDNAGNTATSSAVALTTTGLAAVSMSASPTEWTNGNVTVTISYPLEVVTKQYSLNGTVWNTYTSPIVVTTNNTTVYARGLDAGNNQTSQATLSVTNIDKVNPINSVTTVISTVDGIANLNFAAQDANSGLSNIYVYVNGALYNTQTYIGNIVTLKSFNLDINIPFGESKTVYLVAKDFANNIAQSNTVTISNLTAISTIEDLAVLANSVNSGTNYLGKTIKQLENINIAGNSTNQWTPIGNSTNQFKGTYDGNDKTISGIYINNSLNNQALFGYNAGTIKNLYISNSYIKGQSAVASIVGHNVGIVEYCGILNNSTINANNTVGGIVGRNSGGTVRYCYNKNNVSAVTVSVGGIVGLLDSGIVEQCYNTGNISTTGSDSLGGIVGSSSMPGAIDLIGTGIVRNCYNTGTISGATYCSGGVLGYNTSLLENCYNIGGVNGKPTIGDSHGGVAGVSRGQIKNCYNMGVVTANTYYGSVVGNNENKVYTTISNSYYLAGTAPVGLNGIGSVTSVATVASIKTLMNTNLINALPTVWKADTGNINNGYPILVWQ